MTNITYKFQLRQFKNKFKKLLLVIDQSATKNRSPNRCVATEGRVGTTHRAELGRQLSRGEWQTRRVASGTESADNTAASL